MTKPGLSVAGGLRWLGRCGGFSGLWRGRRRPDALAGRHSRRRCRRLPRRPSEASASRGPCGAGAFDPAAPVGIGGGHDRAVHETSIGSKLLAQVVEVDLKAGQKVREGDVLIRLDDTDLRAKLQQAKAAVLRRGGPAQAAADERRYAQLVQSRTVSQQQYDKAVAALRSAQADLRRAEAGVNEVQATLDCATIRSPIDGP